MSRRSDNPMTILALGILLMAAFGVALVLLTDKTPVLRLRPELEEKFKAELRTRFRTGAPGRPAALEVILKEAESYPAAEDLALAEFSLSRYIALATETEVGTTSVEQVEVRVEGQPGARFVLTRLQLQSKEEALRQVPGLAPMVERYGFKDVVARFDGYSRTGARILIECAPVKQDAGLESAARRVIGTLQSRLFVGSLELRVAGSPPLVLLGGRDTPLRSPPGQARRRRRPRPPASPAPVASTSQGG